MTDQLAPADLIRKHFVTKEKGDREELRKEIAPDVRWWAPVSAAAKGVADNPMLGADRAIDHLTVEMYEEEGREWTITHLLSEGDLVAVRATLQARVAKNGKDYFNTYLFLYRVTDGRIAEAWVELDTAYAFEKFA
jgi:ketosteroid isomerase-like protein